MAVEVGEWPGVGREQRDRLAASIGEPPPTATTAARPNVRNAAAPASTSRAHGLTPTPS